MELPLQKIGHGAMCAHRAISGLSCEWKSGRVITFNLPFDGAGAESQMARIIYAAAGEGFGHASRVHLIAQRLLDAGHEVMFASSHRGLLYLRQYYGEQVKEIFGLTFEYSRGYVEPRTWPGSPPATG
jgi:hypothetical protein